ncbi:hypothetical protein MRB53_040589 [Persea americana]|nr:hypothetical protein MRB53_040589 [Persea americana]
MLLVARRLQVSLETVVAELATFDTSEPRDLIYALLNLAKDSQRAIGPPADFVLSEHKDETKEEKEKKKKKKEVLETFRRSFPSHFKGTYPVQYENDIVDVYKHFITYAISHADEQRALDVICRPFAKSYTKEDNDKYKLPSKDEKTSDSLVNGDQHLQ